MVTQCKQERNLNNKIEGKINKLGEIKKMILNYNDKLPDGFEYLSNELITNIEVNLDYLERIFSLPPTIKNINNLLDEYEDNWDLFISL